MKDDNLLQIWFLPHLATFIKVGCGCSYMLSPGKSRSFFSRFLKSPVCSLLTLLSFSLVFLIAPPTVYAQSGSPFGNTSETDLGFGEQVLAELQNSYTTIYRHPKAGVLEEALSKISDCSKYKSEFPWRLFIFDDDTVLHAAAVRGNYVFVWTGLINSLSEEEIRAVAVHLVAHVMAGHTEPDPKIEAQKLLLETASGVGRIVSGRRGVGRIATDGVSNIGSAILRRKRRRSEGYYYFSQRQEEEADALGVKIAVACGLDPKESLFLFMRSENDRSFAESFKFFKKHQAYPGRLEKLGKLVEENPVSSSTEEKHYPPVAKSSGGGEHKDTFDMRGR